MKFKHKTFFITTNLLALVKNQFAAIVKMGRTDNALEFLKSKCNLFFLSQGLFVEPLVPALLNKMELYKGNISFFLVWLGL